MRVSLHPKNGASTDPASQWRKDAASLPLPIGEPPRELTGPEPTWGEPTVADRAPGGFGGAVRPLPIHPSLEYERKQAKGLLRQLRAGDAPTHRRAAAQHAAFRQASSLAAPALGDAQLVVAREYGFTSWPRLVRYVTVLEREASANRSRGLWKQERYDRDVQLLLDHHAKGLSWAGRTASLRAPALRAEHRRGPCVADHGRGRAAGGRAATLRPQLAAARRSRRPTTRGTRSLDVPEPASHASGGRDASPRSPETPAARARSPGVVGAVRRRSADGIHTSHAGAGLRAARRSGGRARHHRLACVTGTRSPRCAQPRAV